MCCGLAVLGILGPRALVVFWWLMEPVRWSATFGGSALLPVLGFLFLPWTTIMYVLMWTTTGLDFFGWLMVGLGLLADLGTYGGGAVGNKDKVQSYYGNDPAGPASE